MEPRLDKGPAGLKLRFAALTTIAALQHPVDFILREQTGLLLLAAVMTIRLPVPAVDELRELIKREPAE